MSDKTQMHLMDEPPSKVI